MSEKVLKIGILKNGTIGSSLLLAFLLDERAESKNIIVREVTSGAKMNPPEECLETMKKLLEFEPDLIIMSSPNAALKGPKAASKLLNHSKMSTTELYLDNSQETIESAIDLVSGGL